MLPCYNVSMNRIVLSVLLCTLCNCPLVAAQAILPQHDPVLATITTRLNVIFSHSCPLAKLSYTDNSTRQNINQQHNERLVASYHIGTFKTYGVTMLGRINKKILRKETGPANDGFLAIIYTEAVSHTEDRSQFEYPHTFYHPHAEGSWIEYINRCQKQDSHKVLWLSLSFGAKTNRTLLKQIKQIVFENGLPISH